MPLRLIPTLFVVFAALGSLLPLSATSAAEEAIDPAAVEFFEREVRPLLAGKCFSCHSDAIDEPRGGLRLDSRDFVLAGGDSGPAAEPGSADTSLLIEAIAYEGGLDMPPSEPLSAKQKEVLAQWVRMGLPWTPQEAADGEFSISDRVASHWAWRGVAPSIPPEVEDRSWSRSPIDRFIARGLDDAGLRPAGRADRPALLRRLYFDLVGLPPTPEAIDRFVEDDSPAAVERVVDRLLADPQFGVRWGRHWLDVVRYAETYGHEFDFPIPEAWRYRDYVVAAINEDLPYDQFAREQIAGDLLENPRRDRVDQTNLSLIGSGFWWLGDAVHAPVNSRADHAVRVDNQIDVAGKTFIGMTIACARCHDHKFDAISQADYYAIGGLLQSTTRSFSWIDPNGRTAASMSQIKRAAERMEKAVRHQIEKGVETEPDLKADPLIGGGTAVGWAFASPARDGTAVVVRQQEGATQRNVVAIEPASWPDSSHAGRRAVGVWRSPPFVIRSPALAYRLIGAGGAQLRLVVDGFFMNDYHPLLFDGMRVEPETGGRWQWHVQRGDLHHYVGHTAHIELVDEGDGYIGLSEIRWLEEGDEPPSDAPGDSLSTLIDVATLDQDVQARVAHFLDAAERFVTPQRVLAAAPLVPRDIPLAIRGNADDPGELVQRGDLTALAPPAGAASEMAARDRRHLALSWTSSGNPLFSRVAVNRLWHHLTGRGLVGSCDNFGVLGEYPSHPELLDFLAHDFAASGWSSKRTIRQIVTSSTYATSSIPPPGASVADAEKHLLSSMRVRRLEGEVIRDAALALAGRLVRQVGGPSVPVHLTETMTGRGRPAKSGRVDGDGRRSLFVEVRRNFLPPMMLAFDTPLPFATVGKRNVSNVPAQALVLLNDPLVRQLSAAWADRIGGLGELGDRERIERMYREAYGRQPGAVEMETALGFIHSVDDSQRSEAWRELAHAMMNVKEFVYIP